MKKFNIPVFVALFALITVLAVMAIVLNEIVRVAERRFTRWKR